MVQVTADLTAPWVVCYHKDSRNGSNRGGGADDHPEGDRRGSRTVDGHL